MAKSSSVTDSRSSPEWQVFVDATCAGLSALVPLPLLDLVFEAFFRRRMPQTIARHRRAEVDAEVLRRLGRGKGILDLRGCLSLPFILLRWIVKRMWRKIIYVLAIADAATQLSEYWHRAYLLDHLVRSGRLHGNPDRAAEVFDQVLDKADTSPIRGVARDVVASARRVPRLLARARRDPEAAPTQEQERLLRANWARVETSLQAVVTRFEEVWAETGSDVETLER